MYVRGWYFEDLLLNLVFVLPLILVQPPPVNYALVSPCSNCPTLFRTRDLAFPVHWAFDSRWFLLLELEVQAAG